MEPPQSAERIIFKEDEYGVIMGDIQVLLFGSLVFLGVVFLLGLIVNLPAAIIYCRSRLIRGFTDKFILFVLIVDLLSLFILIPISFLFVLEYTASIGDGNAAGIPVAESLRSGDETRPFFLDSQKVYFKKSGASDENDSEFSSYCVQQWIFLIHKLIILMAANLSVLGALKIAVERYLAVVAPLHYHKILKSSVIFFVALFSFILSLACAVITALDPADFSGTFLLENQCSFKLFGQSPLSSSWSSAALAKKQVSSLPPRFDLDDDLDNSDFSDLEEKESVLKSLPEAIPVPNNNIPYQSLHHDADTFSSPVAFWWWPVLKIVQALVFFLVPVAVMLFMYLRIQTEARKQNHRMTYRNKSSFILPPANTTAADAKKPVGFNVDGLHQVFGKFKLVQRIKRKTRMDRAARVTVLTIGLSVICYGPLFYVQISSAVSTLTKSHLSINPWNPGSFSSSSGQGSQFAKFVLPTLLACLHPLLSPLVYVYRYKRVRNELKALLKKMISRCCFCCCNCDNRASSSTATSDCQEVVRQFNHMAQQKLPPSPSSQPHHHNQMLESQRNKGSDSGNDGAITLDMQCAGIFYDEDGNVKPANPDNSHYHYYASSSHSQHPSNDFMCDDEEDYEDDLVGRQEYLAAEAEFSDMESQRDEHGEHVISTVRPNGGSHGGGFLNILNGWMSSYSRRWNQHRESVTSTASFITLLSNRSRSIPSSAADVI